MLWALLTEIKPHLNTMFRSVYSVLRGKLTAQGSSRYLTWCWEVLQMVSYETEVKELEMLSPKENGCMSTVLRYLKSCFLVTLWV